MAFLSVEIRDFRNLVTASLVPSPNLNLIVGENGSGKTSLLEACYFVGHGRSFRTRHMERVVRDGAVGCRVVATVGAEATAAQTVLGIERVGKEMRVRMGGEPVRSLAVLAARLPMRVVNPDSHHLLDGGPQFRRRFLDWGVFHVEHGYLGAWQKYAQVLRQRNAALRARLPARAVTAWDPELIAAAHHVNRLREHYVAGLAPVVVATAERLLGEDPLHLAYAAGWPRQQSFPDALKAGLERDRAQGYTHYGPHRADLAISWRGHATPERISRGQQKQLAIALLLAQGAHFVNATRRQCCYLVDDLAAELDRNHRDRVMNELQHMGAQVWVTAIDPDALATAGWSGSRLFHVEHGEVREVVY